MHTGIHAVPVPFSPAPALVDCLPSFPTEVKVIYSTNPAEIDDFLKRLPNPLAVLGFDTESRPQFRKGQPGNPPCLLQLSTASEALVVHLRINGRNQPQALTPLLRSTLESPKILKVGVAAVTDGRGLEQHFGVHVKGCLDVDKIAEYWTGHKIFGESKHERLVRLEKERLARETEAAEKTPILPDEDSDSSVDGSTSGLLDTLSILAATSTSLTSLRAQLPGYGMKNLSSFFLSYTPAKPKSVQLSNWEAFPLEKKQLDYAALDAWLGLVLYERLKWLAGSQNMRTWEAELGKLGHWH